MKTVLIGGFVAAWAAALQQDYKAPQPQKEHLWLKQLVGEWDSECECFMEEGKTEKSKGTESGKMVGDFWAVMKNKGQFQGKEFIGVFTLGFDPEKKAFVGTWYDNMSSYLWQYTGKIDSAGKILTLESEGPCPQEGGKMVKVREILEIKTPEHKVFTSMREKDGKWVKGMVINYKKRAAE